LLLLVVFLLGCKANDFSKEKGFFRLSFLIARDTMHQNQWMAVLEDLGNVHPIPNSFPQSQEHQQFNYTFVSTNINQEPSPHTRWTEGPSIDDKGTFTFMHAEPMGGMPDLSMPDPLAHAQTEQMVGREMPTADKSFIEKAKDVISGK
jgi:Mn-containing catalase